jgi:hypothetical protein
MKVVRPQLDRRKRTYADSVGSQSRFQLTLRNIEAAILFK